jgi:hypothetical protein
MRHILLAAAVLAASPASAGQMLVATPRGPVYAPAYRYSGAPSAARYYAPPRAGWLAPRGQYLQGYLSPPAIIGGAIAGALLGAAATVSPQVLPPPRPVAAPVPDAMDEIADTNPQGVTRQEVEEAIADFCSRNATASLCVKLQSR